MSYAGPDTDDETLPLPAAGSAQEGVELEEAGLSPGLRGTLRADQAPPPPLPLPPVLTGHVSSLPPY